VGAELFQADRQTDRRTDTMNQRVAFGSLANAPNKTNVTLSELALKCHKLEEQSVDLNSTVCKELQVSSLVDCQQAASSVHYITCCKHSLVLLRMGEIIVRNMLSWLKLLIKLLMLHLVGCLYYCINDARSHKYQSSLISCIRGRRFHRKIGTYLPTYTASHPWEL